MIFFGNGANSGACLDCEDDGCLCYVSTLAVMAIVMIIGIMFIVDGTTDHKQNEEHNIYKDNLTDTFI